MVDADTDVDVEDPVEARRKRQAEIVAKAIVGLVMVILLGLFALLIWNNWDLSDCLRCDILTALEKGR